MQLTLENKKIELWIPIIAVELLLGLTAVLIPSYVFILFGIALFALLIFIWPELSYYLFILMLGNHLMKFAFNDFLLPELLSYLFILPVIPCWIFARMANTRAAGLGNPIALPMSFFFLWGFTSLSWASVLNDGLISLILLSFCYLMFYFSIAIIRTKKTFNTVIWLIIFLGAVNSIVVLYTIYSPYNEMIMREIFRYDKYDVFLQFNLLPGGRGSGLSHPNTTAMLLNTAIMFSIGILLSQENIRRKILMAIIIVLMVTGLLGTLSKGAFLGFAGGLLLFILNIKSLRQRFFLITSVVSISVIFLFILTRLKGMSRAFSEGIVKTISSDPQSSFLIRFELWGTTLESFLDSYGFGVGTGNFYFVREGLRWHPHSIYFSVLFMLGFIGLWIWIWLWIKAFSTTISTFKKCFNPYYKNMLLSIIAAWATILIFGLVEVYYLYSDIWVVLGIGLALVNIAAQDRQISNEFSHAEA